MNTHTYTYTYIHIYIYVCLKQYINRYVPSVDAPFDTALGRTTVASQGAAATWDASARLAASTLNGKRSEYVLAV